MSIVHLPPAERWKNNQPAVEAIFGNTPRIVAASIIAFWCGSFVNSFVMAKMKIWTQGALAVEPDHRLDAVRRAGRLQPCSTRSLSPACGRRRSCSR